MGPSLLLFYPKFEKYQVLNYDKTMLILGIETSCDDTSVALIECRPPSPRQKLGYSRVKILSSVVSSQTKVHAPYGGVVPNLAARAHLKNIKPVFDQALKQAVGTGHVTKTKAQ